VVYGPDRELLMRGKVGNHLTPRISKESGRALQAVSDREPRGRMEKSE
jgi:hypothetical protein